MLFKKQTLSPFEKHVFKTMSQGMKLSRPEMEPPCTTCLSGVFAEGLSLSELQLPDLWVGTDASLPGPPKD